MDFVLNYMLEVRSLTLILADKITDTCRLFSVSDMLEIKHENPNIAVLLQFLQK